MNDMTLCYTCSMPVDGRHTWCPADDWYAVLADAHACGVCLDRAPLLQNAGLIEEES